MALYVEKKPRRQLLNPFGLSQDEMLELSKIELNLYVERNKEHIKQEFQESTHGRRLTDLLPDVDRIVESLEMLFKTFEVVDVRSVSYKEATPHITIRIPDVRFRCRSYVKYGEIFVQYRLWATGIELVFYNTLNDYDGSIYLSRAYHPHITEGRACLGSWEVSIKQAINTGDLFVLSRQVRKFLNSYYGRSTYTHADYYRPGHRLQIVSSYAYKGENIRLRDCKYHVSKLIGRVRTYCKAHELNKSDYLFLQRIKDLMVEFHCSASQAANILWRFVKANSSHSALYFKPIDNPNEVLDIMHQLAVLKNNNGRYLRMDIPAMFRGSLRDRTLRYSLPDTLMKRIYAIYTELENISRPMIYSSQIATLDVNIIKSCIWDKKNKTFKKTLKGWKVPDEIFKKITEPPNTKELEEQAKLEILRARKLITREIYKHFSKLAKGAFDEANNIDAPASANQLSFETLS